jgi:hypothetical protein
LPYTKRALGLGDLSRPLELHPLVWAINQTGDDLAIALSSLFDTSYASKTLPVEYLPIVSMDSYFTTPRKASTEYISKILLQVHAASDEEVKSSESERIENLTD